MSARARFEFNQDREDEYDPVILPEIEPGVRGRNAQSAVERLVTIADSRNRGEEVEFMVETGAMI